VAAGLESVRRTDHLGNPGGRSATALSFTSAQDPITWTAYFDPATRQLMAWTSVYEGNPPAWIVLESAVVDAPGVQPTAEESLFPQPSFPVEPSSPS
jgi:hypothetical protein